jgi:class 3 adenylate cyclase/tetratricopeptide (TPR) repeat protein
VRCPSCGGENGEDLRFCEDCGAPLAAQCPSCGAAVAAGKRFCGRCGAQLTAGAQGAARSPLESGAERKVVSVLFADLVGFTPMAEQRDAEAVRELLSGYFEVARTVIARYGGSVEKFIGDAVMAVWGAPAAHGNDAERAVRAALDLVESVPAFSAMLQVRAGVVTGEVAVTLGVTGQSMVVGDAVNTAARIQAEAEPGTVLVDDTTRQATTAAIGYTDAGPRLLKGKADAVRLWQATRVVGAIGGAERVDGLEAGFLARERELRAVKEEFHAAADQKRARLISVVGAAGVGKSRLRWEFYKYTDGLAETVLWHAGRCPPYGDGIAYWALAEMVRARLDIAEEEPTDQVSAKLTAGLERWVSDPTDRTFLLPRLGALLGVADPGLGRDDLFAGWRLWLERLAEHNPVVLVVEDLQWADAGLLDFLEHLLDWSAEHPLFLLSFARPDLLERRPGWGAGRRNATTLTLDPLPDAVMTQLLGELVADLPSDVTAQIVGQADGIPLYAVELVRSLIDRDLVQPVDGRYRLIGEVGALNVPASLASLVAARIDALPAEERALVQALAVLGATFPRAAVAAISDAPPDVVDRLLVDLVRKEVLTVRTDRLSPDRGQYAFTQSLLRTVAYDTLSRQDRKSRHLAVASHLRATFPDEGAEVAEVIAEHYREALQAAPDDADAPALRVRAVAAFDRAGQRALTIGAPETAERAFVTAAELADGEDERAALTEQAGDAALLGGGDEVARERFEAVLHTHESAGRYRDAGRLTGKLGRALFALGRGDQAIPLLRAAIDRLSGEEPDRVLTGLHLALATNLHFSGRGPEAAPHVDEALRLAQALELSDLLADAAGRRADVLAYQNRTPEAGAYYRWSIEIAERHGLSALATRVHTNAGSFGADGDDPTAVEHSETAMELARRRGDWSFQVVAGANLVKSYIFLGRWTEAEKICQDLLAGPQVRAADQLRARLVVLHAWRGNLAAAEQMLRETTLLPSNDDVQDRSLHKATVATYAAAAGDWVSALDAATAACREAIDALGLAFESVRQAWPEAMDAALNLGRLDVANDLMQLISNQPIGFIPPYLRAQQARFRARLATTSGRHDGVEDHFRTGEAILADLGYPYWLARVQVDYAEWLIEQHRHDDARSRLAEALGGLERLDAQPAVAQARDLLRMLSTTADAPVPGQQTSSAISSP